MSNTLLSTDEARAKVLSSARSVSETELIPLSEALNRVLAEGQVSNVNVPPLDNSAMDGYAVRSADVQPDAWLPVTQRIPAGTVGTPLKPGEVARIFTGAPVPQGADAVLMQENCATADNTLQARHVPRPGENIRRAGEDIQIGQTVLNPGDRLTAARLGVAASVGATQLRVYRRLKVAVFFTGDEIVMPGQPLLAGQIYNSNRATLTALLQDLGCEIIDLGQVPDTLEATLAALKTASQQADVIVTSGGVSVGEEDHVKHAVEQLGQIEMWKVAMKPGKPLVYGRIENTGNSADFLGLPGNPVSAFVVFGLFARPFLLKRMGAAAPALSAYSVPASFDWPKAGTRREFLRARLENGRATLYPSQSSGVLTSLAWADGLVDIDIGCTVKQGDTVSFLPLAELLA